MATILLIAIPVVAFAGTIISLVRRSWLRALLWMVGGVGAFMVAAVVTIIIVDPWQGDGPRMMITKGNMGQLGLGLLMYADDNDGELPPTLGAIFTPYVGYGSCYLVGRSGTPCPQSGQEVDDGQCDLLYFGAGKKLAECAKDEPLVTTKPILAKKAKYACVLCADGHAELHKPVPESLKAWWQQHPEGQQSP